MVDCEKVLNQDQMKQYDIKGYPHIVKKKEDNTYEQYSGDRSSDSLEQFAASA